MQPRRPELQPVRPASRSGQVMIITILALGGTLLGATTVAGLLTLYQIRNSTDLALAWARGSLNTPCSRRLYHNAKPVWSQ